MADLKSELETWTDEVEGDLEKRKICGVPITRKVTVPLLVLFFASIFVIGVVFGAKEGRHANNSSPVESTDTVTNTKSLRYKQALDIIEPLVGPDVKDITSPQHRAVNWLANVDPLELDFEDTDLDQLIQRYVLTVVYYATGGENWEYQYNFLSEDSVCAWNMEIESEIWGASCFDHIRVNNLFLENNNLQGTIPGDIGLIPKLEYLGLSGNSLREHIPTTIGLLSNLIKLDLSKYDICKGVEDIARERSLCSYVKFCCT
jgi:hypothetical protein